MYKKFIMVKKDIEKKILMELLAISAVECLSTEDQQQLSQLLAKYPEFSKDEFVKTTALSQIGFYMMDHTAHETIPTELRNKILADYDNSKSSEQNNLAAPILPRLFKALTRPSYAWGITAMLMIGLSYSMITFKTYENNYRYLPLKKMVLQNTADDLMQYPWYGKTTDFENIKGDMIWSNQKQKGFIKITGLPMNDPSRNQYQIWIVDPIKYQNPVDGGVFDITKSDREIIIPINPKLPISNARAFAITLEQPGGVVVSSQPLLLTAPEERPKQTI